MFLSRGDRDLGVAFQTHPGSQASSRGEEKDCTLLSSRDGYFLEPTEWPKVVKPTVEFGERTQDCSPGHAGKEGPHFAMTGASRGFSRAAAPMSGFSRGTTGSSESLSCSTREVSSPCTWRGGPCYCSRVMAAELGLKKH